MKTAPGRLGFVLALALGACDRGSAPAATTSASATGRAAGSDGATEPVEAAWLADGDLPVPEDFEEEVDKTIDKGNFERELGRVEQELDDDVRRAARTGAAADAGAAGAAGAGGAGGAAARP